MGSPNFGDPLWGEVDWGGSPSTPTLFPPDDSERGNIDIDQIRTSVKSGGKSQIDSQFVTTVGSRIPGNGGVWDADGNWIDSGVSAGPTAPPPGPTPILDSATGNPIADSSGNWIFAG